MQYLEGMGNFNGVFQMVSAFHSSAVHRLQNTMNNLPSRHLSMFRKSVQFISNKENYKSHRQALAKDFSPKIPYLGMYLTDITFIDEGNPTLVDGSVNINKLKILGKTLVELNSFRSQKYTFTPHYKIQKYLLTKPVELDDNQWFDLSRYIEPKVGATPTELTDALKSIIEARNEQKQKRERRKTQFKLFKNKKGDKKDEFEDLKLDEIIEQENRINSKFDTHEKIYIESLDIITKYMSDMKQQMLKQIQSEKEEAKKEILLLREKTQEMIATERALHLQERTNIIAQYQKEIETLKSQKVEMEREIQRLNTQTITLEKELQEAKSREVHASSKPLPVPPQRPVIPVSDSKKPLPKPNSRPPTLDDSVVSETSESVNT